MRIAVLLSGGVDSSVALRLLQEQGEKDLTAFYLKIWLEDELASLGACPWEEDLSYARAVCEQAGVPLKIINLQKEYYDRVVSYALEELQAGRTPSPDIFCNQRIKFGAFWEQVSADFDRIATGHYARILRDPSGPAKLLRGPDPVKDQSYFLSHLSAQQVERLLFPVGELHKERVRELAREWELPNRDRPDSQGICFLGKIKYPEFVRHYLGDREGDIVHLSQGKVLGRHRGFWYYTIGQRTGLGLGNGPWYVVSKDPESNRVYVAHQSESQDRNRRVLQVGRFSWIHGGPREGEDLLVKLRHGPQLIPAQIRQLDNPDLLEVRLDEDDPGVSPGQFTVFYRGEECLGGAMILG